MKAAGIGCAALVALVILGIAASVFWFSRNKDELSAGTEKGAIEGQRFGPGTDEAGCEAEAKRRAGEDATLAAQMGVGAFFRACLGTSRETPGFCENVPPPTAIRRSVEWRTARCSGDVTCAAMAPVIQQYCGEGRPKGGVLDSLGVQAPAAGTGGVDSAGY
jgi:hypothetical protein